MINSQPKTVVEQPYRTDGGGQRWKEQSQIKETKSRLNDYVVFIIHVHPRLTSKKVQ